MKIAPHHGKLLRKGSKEHLNGLAHIMLVELADFPLVADRRHRSELAARVSNGTLRHQDVVLAV
jgi:hypothetical protein